MKIGPFREKTFPGSKKRKKLKTSTVWIGFLFLDHDFGEVTKVSRNYCIFGVLKELTVYITECRLARWLYIEPDFGLKIWPFEW